MTNHKEIMQLLETLRQMLSAMHPQNFSELNDVIVHIEALTLEQEVDRLIDKLQPPTTHSILSMILAGMPGFDSLPGLTIIPLGRRPGLFDNKPFSLMSDPFFPEGMPSLAEMLEGLEDDPDISPELREILSEIKRGKTDSETLVKTPLQVLIEDMKNAAADEPLVHTEAEYLEMFDLTGDEPDELSLGRRMMGGSLTPANFQLTKKAFYFIEALIQQAKDKMSPAKEAMLKILVSILEQQLLREGQVCPVIKKYGNNLLDVRPMALSPETIAILAKS